MSLLLTIKLLVKLASSDCSKTATTLGRTCLGLNVVDVVLLVLRGLFPKRNLKVASMMNVGSCVCLFVSLFVCLLACLLAEEVGMLLIVVLTFLWRVLVARLRI
jgi:hypothetical protein